MSFIVEEKDIMSLYLQKELCEVPSFLASMPFEDIDPT